MDHEQSRVVYRQTDIIIGCNELIASRELRHCSPPHNEGTSDDTHRSERHTTQGTGTAKEAMKLRR